MKKPLIVVTLLLLVLCIGASAAETCFTLPDIREQAKQGWHQTYTAHGREVVVDIEIVVPDASRFPVLKAKSLHPTASVPLQRLGKDKRLVQDGIMLSNTTRSFIYSAPDDDSLARITRENPPPKGMFIQSELVYAPNLTWEKTYSLNNPLTLNDAYQLLLTTVSNYFNDIPLHFTPGFVSADLGIFVLDSAKGAVSAAVWEGYQGALNIRFYQELEGIPVLGTAEMARRSKSGSAGFDSPFFTIDLANRVYLRPLEVHGSDQVLQRVILALLAQKEVVYADVPLCSLDKVIRAYESLIESGQLRRVDSIRLGFAGWFLKDGQTLLLTPCYLLSGLLYEDGDTTGEVEGMELLKEGQHRAFILVNAQTGELMDPWRTDSNRAADAPRIITWK